MWTILSTSMPPPMEQITAATTTTSKPQTVVWRTVHLILDTHTHTHPFNGPLSRTIQVSRYQKGKPIRILLTQETVSGTGISWAICKSAPLSREITTPTPHHSVFYRPDALPATQPTTSKHWRKYLILDTNSTFVLQDFYYTQILNNHFTCTSGTTLGVKQTVVVLQNSGVVNLSLTAEAVPLPRFCSG